MRLTRSIALLALSVAMASSPGLNGVSQAAPARDSHIVAIAREIRSDRIEASIRKLVSFGTRSTLSDQQSDTRGIGAASRWIASEFSAIASSSHGALTVSRQTFLQPVAARIPQPTNLTNIVATLKGTLPDAQSRVLVVSGHYDSMCTDPTDGVHDAPGANDDASGAAAVLEIARVMTAHGPYPATIVFMCVAGEEQGLLGSTYFAQTAKTDRMPIAAMFTNDIIGSSTGGNGVHDAHSVRVFSEGVPSDETEAQAASRRSIGGENDGRSRQLARYIREAARLYVPDMKVDLIYRRDRYLRGGDHIPFLERGYAAVRFTEPNEDYTHQHQNVRVDNGITYGDLPEFVDFEYVARVARVNAVSLAELALAPTAPSGVGLVTSRLTNDTQLVWSPSPGAVSYEVVWRATSESDWTHVKNAGKVTQYTVPGLSKDNFILGVRAVDGMGHKSPVVYPRPVR